MSQDYGHAGIINTINYAKKATKINKVFAVLGGFHLTGGIYEESIEPTIKEWKKQILNILYLVIALAGKQLIE